LILREPCSNRDLGRPPVGVRGRPSSRPPSPFRAGPAGSVPRYRAWLGLATPPGRPYNRTSMPLLSLWGILDRRQPWAFRFQRAEARMKRCASVRPTSSIPSGMDRRRKRLPPPGSNPSDLIPLSPR